MGADPVLSCEHSVDHLRARVGKGEDLRGQVAGEAELRDHQEQLEPGDVRYRLPPPACPLGDSLRRRLAVCSIYSFRMVKKG